MTHPNQLNIFAPIASPQGPRLERDLPPKAKLDDLGKWREGDLLDLLELLVELMQSQEWQAHGTTAMLMQGAADLNLPASLTTMLLNTLPRLERLLGIADHVAPKIVVDDEAKALPNVAALAKYCGLGGVFSKEVGAIWKQAPNKPAQTTIVPPSEPVAPIVPDHASDAPMVANIHPISQPSQLAITTNGTGSGRQWKIAGTLISEVAYVENLGHIGKFHAGAFQFQTRPYSASESAATQCRSFVEGVLKILKTIPR